jgi:hypothetical protein
MIISIFFNGAWDPKIQRWSYIFILEHSKLSFFESFFVNYVSILEPCFYISRQMFKHRSIGFSSYPNFHLVLTMAGWVSLCKRRQSSGAPQGETTGVELKWKIFCVDIRLHMIQPCSLKNNMRMAAYTENKKVVQLLYRKCPVK